MTTYRVAWEMDVEADSPQEAAKQARFHQLDPQAQVGYFTVHWRDPGQWFHTADGKLEVAVTDVDLDGTDIAQ